MPGQEDRNYQRLESLLEWWSITAPMRLSAAIFKVGCRRRFREPTGFPRRSSHSDSLSGDLCSSELLETPQKLVQPFRNAPLWSPAQSRSALLAATQRCEQTEIGGSKVSGSM